jgi:hypothetical protein
MFFKKKKIEEKLLNELVKINNQIYEGKVLDMAELLGNPKKMLLRNFTSGLIKGIGAGIGFSIITAIIIYAVQKIIKLNIPVISEYIADIVEIVQKNR